jgi:hypothetical protein
VNLIAKTLGALALNFLLLALWIMVTGLCLWWLVPMAFPALGFGFTNGVGLAGLLFLVKGLYTVK